MRLSVIIRPEAESDLQDAFQWYEQQGRGLGKKYLRCIDVAVTLISRSPQIFPAIYKDIRRALILRRHPKHWQKRR